MTEHLRPVQWLTELLDRHGLNTPDGRPLYQYRVTDREYKQLQELLFYYSKSGVGVFAKRPLAWDIVFVMYSAEWWRRSYSGKWRWQDIFTSIGLNSNDFSVGQRNRIIETGLQRWKRSVRRINGWSSYLGSVATEGGLPLRQLKESGGWLQIILRPVLRKHIQRGGDPLLLISGYRDSIPVAYQREEIFNILNDIVLTVASLKKDNSLDSKDNPVEWLDQHQLNWRDQFPLPLDDELSNRLLTDLVCVAASAQEEDQTNPFSAERYLTNFDTHQPQINTSIDVPSFVSVENLNLGIPYGELPPRLDIYIASVDGRQWALAKAYKTNYRGKPSFKLTGRRLHLEGEEACAALLLQFMSIGKVVADTSVENGNEIFHDVPWVFTQFDGRWLLQGQATQSTKEERAVVYIPEKMKYSHYSQETDIFTHSPFLKGSLVLLSGKMLCTGEEGDKYLISTRQEDQTIVQYSLKGKHYKYKSLPSETYIGKPSLVVENTLTGEKSIKKESRLVGKPLSVRSAWKPLFDLDCGVHEFRLNDDKGHIRFKKRIALLPEEFSVCFESTKDPKKGYVSFNGVKPSSVHLITQDIRSRKISDNSKTIFELIADGDPRDSATFELEFPGQLKNITLETPYPSSGVMLLDSEGRQVSRHSNVYVNRLHGFRIKIFNLINEAGRTGDLRFSLSDKLLRDVRDIFIRYKIDLRDDVTEIALIDWIEPIQNLLTVAMGLDAFVKCSLLMNGREHLSIKVKRYEVIFEPDWDAGRLMLESDEGVVLEQSVIDGIKVHAMRLIQPEQQDVVVNAETSEGVGTRRWTLDRNKMKDEHWLIYPPEESSIRFRPLMSTPVSLYENYDYKEVTSLQGAIAIPDQEIRSEKIDLVLREMTSNLDHGGWSYLENLFKKVGHLPLTTFDVWLHCASNMEFLAALVINGREITGNRIIEDLPVVWELIPLLIWRKALYAYRDRILAFSSDEEDDLDELLHDLLERKIELIAELSDAMSVMGQILSAEVLGQTAKELYLMGQCVAVKGMLIEEHRQLLQRQSESIWPEMLGPNLRVLFNKMPQNMRDLIRLTDDHKDVVTLLPFVLAEHVLDDVLSEWTGAAVQVFKIQQLRNFDEDWFTAAFQYVLGFYYQQSESNGKVT